MRQLSFGPSRTKYFCFFPLSSINCGGAGVTGAIDVQHYTYSRTPHNGMDFLSFAEQQRKQSKVKLFLLFVSCFCFNKAYKRDKLSFRIHFVNHNHYSIMDIGAWYLLLIALRTGPHMSHFDDRRQYWRIG